MANELEDDINVVVSFGNVYGTFTTKLETMTKDGATAKAKTEEFLCQPFQLSDSKGKVNRPGILEITECKNNETTEHSNLNTGLWMCRIFPVHMSSYTYPNFSL